MLSTYSKTSGAVGEVQGQLWIEERNIHCYSMSLIMQPKLWSGQKFFHNISRSSLSKHNNEKLKHQNERFFSRLR